MSKSFDSMPLFSNHNDLLSVCIRKEGKERRNGKEGKGRQGNVVK